MLWWRQISVWSQAVFGFPLFGQLISIFVYLIFPQPYISQQHLAGQVRWSKDGVGSDHTAAPTLMNGFLPFQVDRLIPLFVLITNFKGKMWVVGCSSTENRHMNVSKWHIKASKRFNYLSKVGMGECGREFLWLSEADNQTTMTTLWVSSRKEVSHPSLYQ